MLKQPAPLKNRTEKQRGFSLIELLIVVAVILIIAAIAIPNFIRARMRANETAAVQNLRSINTANTVYLITYGIGFSPDLPTLGGSAVIVTSAAAGLIDSVLSAGSKTGYNFTYTPTATDALGHVVTYSLTAAPTSPGASGDRCFYVDQTNIIRQNTTGGPAVVGDPPI